ncbi:Procollagen-lysine 2-oxoglutarate 5-dioxygenase [Fasciola gigantica]|uniref:Procollagen-lysine 2-oxoglutarate 5-dioxygenase n=1 Tax=Fasciola gigantica TaxID=46835 RepID=A0A504YSA2_FASGI|nr:Procollagen-lysine 2-oxoglutarate 5-dioxygenase [Fasciola gigantica]
MRSCVLFVVFLAVFVKAQEKELLVITVATERNDAFERFMRSAEIYGYDVKVLGMGSTWRGGDVAKSVGGGQKVRLLKEELEDKRSGELLILFVDSYDVLFLDTKEALLKAYEDFGAKVVFGAEDFCWPQQSLADMYPTVKPGQRRFLNSGAFMGPASLLYEIVSASEIKDDDDDQLYYTKLFLNSDMRKRLGMVLDHSATIIQNLNGALNEVEVRFTEETGYLYNIKTNTKPIIVHGNGPIKVTYSERCFTCRGIWNVPFTRDVYLLSRNAMHALMDKRLASAKEVDMEICRHRPRKNVFMMVDNRHSFGYLINAETYSTQHLHNDLWQVFDNPLDWEEQYIHEEYHNVFAPSVSENDIEQPCPDVFWFPMVTEKFCRQLIEEMEHYGQWSDGKNNDPRLEGGYENVPTRDIHMRQGRVKNIGFIFYANTCTPCRQSCSKDMTTNQHQFTLNENSPFKLLEDEQNPWARMNFVVRYRPDEQPSLRPHHDASSYTLNIALNRPGIDYQGGGTRFIRYNCSLIQVKVGWVATFPGRVTHLHEGLETTKGTRYIFVTFVNPETRDSTHSGIWNVPFTRDVYLLSRNAMHALMDKRLASAKEVDMEICRIAREKNVFMMVDNRHTFGYLINAETYSTEHLHNDLWQVFDNPLDWEEQYIHEEYHNVVAPSVSMNDIEQPCPDVFWFPMVTEKFCRQLIEEMEHYGQWSDGKNNDPRLEGGYENVPTRDIHMRQVGWEEHWLHILRKYVHPMQTKLFQGYDDKPWARMNFVVRYRPDEQPSLRPHHDASSYTLNIALNRPGIDYQGGGIRFVRYNCTVTDTKLGWVIASPGRVTHLHEGLTTVSGTRYIFITFVNP